MAGPTILLSKLYEAMLDGSFSDFTIRVESETFNVHRFVLAKQSPFFLALFQAPMKESEANELILDDVEVDVFRLFLEFLYTGRFANIKAFEDNASKLIYCGAKYQLLDLVNKCEKFLCNFVANLSMDNAVNSLMVSHLLPLDDLSSEALAVVSKNWDGAMRAHLWPAVVAQHDLATSIEKLMMKFFLEMHDKEIGIVPNHDENSFSWKIQKTDFPKRSNEYVQSRAVMLTTRGDLNEGFAWKLRIQKRQPDMYSFYLVFAGTGVMPSNVSCKLTYHCPYDGVHRSGVYDFCPSRVQILSLDPLKSEMPGTSDVLYCPSVSEITLELEFISATVAESSSALGGFGDYAENSLFTDGEVSLRDEVFNVHMLLLSSVSSVFKSRFSKNSKIKVTDFEPNAFGCFVKFIYSGTVQQSSEADTLNAAYFFGLLDEQMDHLRAVVVRQFDYSNVLPILRLAHTKRDLFLVENAFEFIFLHFSSLVSLPIWKEMALKPTPHGDFLLFIKTKVDSITDDVKA